MSREKYRPEDKFIIEIEETADCNCDPYRFYKIKNSEKLFTATELDKFEMVLPDEESHLELKASHNEGYKAGYDKGLNDVWELVRKLYLGGKQKYSPEEQKEIFGGGGITYVIEHYTPQEALAKLETYEQEKEIKVGDVVRHKTMDGSFIITHVNESDLYTLINNSGRATCAYKKDLTKTGNHIDIQQILDSIGTN